MIKDLVRTTTSILQFSILPLLLARTPLLIFTGYLRVALFFYAFSVAFSAPSLCLLAYFLSFVCDELDGRFARMLGQESTFGKVLDMVTDRTATLGLLALLCMLYKVRAGLPYF